MSRPSFGQILSEGGSGGQQLSKGNLEEATLWGRLGKEGYGKINDYFTKIILAFVSVYILSNNRNILSNGVYSIDTLNAHLNEHYIQDIIYINRTAEECPNGYSDMAPSMIERSLEGCRCKLMQSFGNETSSGARRAQSTDSYLEDSNSFSISTGYDKEYVINYGFTEEEYNKWTERWSRKSEWFGKLYLSFIEQIGADMSSDEVNSLSGEYSMNLYSDLDIASYPSWSSLYSSIYYSDETMRYVMNGTGYKPSTFYTSDSVAPDSYYYYNIEGSDYDYQGVCAALNLTSNPFISGKTDYVKT